jgi:hypothetical protein
MPGPAAFAARCVGIVRSRLSIRRVAVDHRVHVAGGDAKEQVRPAQGLEGILRSPGGLRDDAHAEPLALQQAPDDRHTEGGMIDVGVAGDDDDVAGIPAQRIHLGARGRQKSRGAIALGPVLRVIEEGGSGAGDGYR